MTTPTAVVLIRPEPFYRRAAIENGLKRLGYKILDRVRALPTSHDDLLVVWNLKAGHDENAATLWEQRGGTVIVMENGYLQKVDKTHYAISTHGHNGSGWFPNGPEDRFKPLGFSVKPQRQLAHWQSEILVCGQRQVGSTLMRSPPQWAEKVARKVGGRVRQHPGNFAAKVPLERDLANARACLIWSSAAGVRAMVEGVPVAHAAPHWICEDAAWRLDELVDNVAPLMSDGAVDWSLRRMAHGQWHHTEIATGEPFARMKAEAWGPRWTTS